MKAILSTVKNNPKKGAILIIVLMFAALLVKCIFTIWGGNYLYADGANFCYTILRNAGGNPAFEGRQGSFFLMELFMVAALKIGITDIRILCALFGLGSVIWLALFSLLAMLLSWRRQQTQFVVVIAVLYTMVNVFTGFFTQIESITAIGIFLYLLVYYMLSEWRRDWFFRITALLLLPLLHNANEYFVGFAAVLAVVILTKIVRDHSTIFVPEYILHLGVVLYTIYTSYMAATHGASTDSLIRSIESLPDKKDYWILIWLLFYTFLVAAFSSFILKGKWSFIIWIPVVLTCIFLDRTVIGNPTLIATQSFSMRFMNLLLPCGIGAILYFLWLFRCNIRTTGLIFMAAVFLVINSVYVVQSAREYHGYLVELDRACDGRSGFFEIRSTNVNTKYTWGWPLPMESVLAQCLAGRTTIQAIIIKDFNASYWEAFDSDNIDAYADFQQYGVILDTEKFR